MSGFWGDIHIRNVFRDEWELPQNSVGCDPTDTADVNIHDLQKILEEFCSDGVE